MNENITDYMKGDILHDTIEEAAAAATKARAEGKIAFVMPYEGYGGTIYYIAHEMSVERNLEVVGMLSTEWTGG